MQGRRAFHALQNCGLGENVVDDPIEPTEKKLVVVKSTNHFMAAYGPIAKKVLYIDADGPIPRDYRKIPYTKVQRPIWPLDEGSTPRLIM